MIIINIYNTFIFRKCIFFFNNEMLIIIFENIIRYT